jgi:carbonic anhydrase
MPKFGTPAVLPCGCAAPLSRRALFTAAAAIGVAAAVPGTASAQSTLPPADALAQLMDGNRRFVAKTMTSFDDDLTLLKQDNAEKQQPFAAVLSCSDSRVPVELVFDQTIGHIFVARVAGNIVTPEIIASLEYGAAVLGTRVLMVMGHSGCGAVKAAIGAGPVPGQISALYSAIRPAVDQAGPDPDSVGRANAQIQARLLREASPVIAGLVRDGSLTVVASYYDVATGTVTLL